jgi:diaminohydroxyphosphoribosylaminopyrimidine deaminase / 5-amino-6-(5-phosphoribosylamino)uracil reductase
MTSSLSTPKPTRTRCSTDVNEHDIRFMERALALAQKGVGLASPNPTVGCVIVRDGQIVGEGFHEYDKLAHAEIVALRMTGEKARGATLYVTLEPCHHTGRTGPCTEAVIAAGVRRVVAAMVDPNPKTSGRGFAWLRGAGVEVETGVLETEAQRLNEAFALWIRTGKPFVTLKSALTLDGQLALPGSRGALKGKNSAPRKRVGWITSEESRAEVQRMRHASDALLTGIGTIHADDPLLNDRSELPRRRRLLRVVLDSTLALPPKSRLVKSLDHDLLVFASERASAKRIRAFRKRGVETVVVPARGGRLDLSRVLAELVRKEIQSVLLESGPTLNGAALQAGIVDKLALFFAPKISGETRVPFAVAPKLQLPALHSTTVRPCGPDFLWEGYLTHVYGNHRA